MMLGFLAWASPEDVDKTPPCGLPANAGDGLSQVSFHG